MHRLILAAAAVGLGVLAASGEATALNGALEHARANARAGGPVSERDAELLERWGCASGTDSAFCHRVDHRSWYPAPRRRSYR